MGTEGMSYSLLSRDIIADSIETVRLRPSCPLSTILSIIESDVKPALPRVRTFAVCSKSVFDTAFLQSKVKCVFDATCLNA
jgi:hypothetical protein